MTYAVVIHLTSKNVKMLYTIGKNAFAYYPLDNNVSEMPLAFYVSGDQLSMGEYAVQRAREKDPNAYTDYFSLLDSSDTFSLNGGQYSLSMLLVKGMEPYLTSFLKDKISVPEFDIERAYNEMPLFLSFADEVLPEKASQVCDTFYEEGFHCATQVSINDILFSTMSNNDRGKVILSGRKDSLYVSFYPYKAQPAAFTHKIDGVGLDPRYRICANYIYEQLCEKHPGIVISKEANWETLQQESQKVMESDSAIYMGQVYLNEGVTLDYMIMKMKLNALLANDTGAQNVLSEVEHVIYDANIQPSQIDLVLEGSVNTDYFIKLFKQHFSQVFHITEQIRKQIWNVFFNKLLDSEVEMPDNWMQSQAVTDLPGSQQTWEPTAPSALKSNGRRLPMPATLHLQEDESNAVLTWTKMGIGRLLVFASETPFTYGKGDAVDIGSLQAEKISLPGDRLIVKKDFSGCRYYLPVVEQDGVTCAGDPVSLLSAVVPKGVKISFSDTAVMIRWNWDKLQGLRIVVHPDNESERVMEFYASDQTGPSYKYSLSRGAKTVTVKVSSIVHRDDGTLLESDVITQTHSLHKVTVNFTGLQSGGLFSKDKFTVTLRSMEPLPCGLSVIVGEGMIPMDLQNYQPIHTITVEDVVPNVENKITFRYNRRSKQQLYVRLIPADPDKAGNINVVPEMQKIN